MSHKFTGRPKEICCYVFKCVWCTGGCEKVQGQCNSIKKHTFVWVLLPKHVSLLVSGEQLLVTTPQNPGQTKSKPQKIFWCNQVEGHITQTFTYNRAEGGRPFQKGAAQQGSSSGQQEDYLAIASQRMKNNSLLYTTIIQTVSQNQK